MIETKTKILIVSFVTLIISLVMGMVWYLAWANEYISPAGAILMELIFIFFGFVLGIFIMLLCVWIDD